MELNKHYEPSAIEERWYAHWDKSGYFHSEPDERPAYSIIIPPPNVTGILHMGHMLNNTIQDVLIRKARKSGFNACWVPGTDHASIATEAKVVRWLREEKQLTKGDMTRDEFMEYAYEWKDKYGGIILNQLKKLGATCDWERTAFTMDETRSEHVIQAFVDLFNKNKLYRDYRMVNWDPEAQTVLSNEEVLYNDENGHLYHVKYQIEGEDGFVVIATTRPETILADAAVAVHPDDERYKHLIGKKVRVPLTDRWIPIIADDYVDIEFGTGCLKVTPAHDPNDYEIGQRHKLEVIEILTDAGLMNEKTGIDALIGLDREVARKKISPLLEAAGLLEKKEEYRHSVGRSERTGVVIEPKLSLQWYVKMDELAKPALDAVMSDEVEFIPANQKNLYKHWMENIRDWCVSRQLWWGHRIPAYYYEDKIYVATTSEEALRQAQADFPNIKLEDLKQDEDVLDTWFSSWLWPIALFNGFNDRTEMDYYYPSSVLVTGWDIIFLWVARMVMAGYEWENSRPFKHVYFTGMVRDKQRRKMSKSLGNSPDALKLIEEYGADGVRFGMLSCSPAGGDLLFDVKLCEQGKNFCNKMWNALRLIKGWEVDNNIDCSEKNKLAIQWIENKINQEIPIIEALYKDFRLSEALIKLYSLIWDDFFSWYLEMIKPGKGEAIDKKTYEATVDLYSLLVNILHPFMPFITEELWHNLADRKAGEDLIVVDYPKEKTIQLDVLSDLEEFKKIVSSARDLRNKSGISQREFLDLSVRKMPESEALFARPGFADLLEFTGRLSNINWVEEDPKECLSFVVGTNKFYLHTGDNIDKGAEKERLEKEIEYAKGFVKSVEKKLSNERFVNNAPAAVVENERQKMADGQERIKILTESLDAL